MKSIFNKTLFKEQIKRFWTVSALTSLIYLLFVVIPVFRYNVFLDLAYRYHDLITILYMINPIITITTILLPLLVVGMLFSYLFQVKASVTILSYPIKRNSLWFTNVVSGFVLMIIPILVISLALLVVVNIPIFATKIDNLSLSNFPEYINEIFERNFRYKDLVNSLSVVSFFFKLLLSITFYYSVFLFAAHLCVNTVIYILLSILLPLSPGVFTIFTNIFLNYYFIGIIGSSISTTFRYTNPIIIGTGEIVPSLIISYLIIMICLFVISFFCNRIRKQENTGDSLVFKFIKYLLVFLITAFGAFLGGYFFFNIFHNLILIYVGAIIGFIITYYITQMFAEKTFYIFKKATKAMPKYIGFTVLVFLMLVSIVKFDLFGYVRYVPKIEDIESVNILHEDYSYIDKPDIIKQVTEVHHKILEHEAQLRKDYFWEGGSIADVYEHGTFIDSRTQEIKYKLKNGKIIKRYYYDLSRQLATETGLFDLYANDEIILSQYDFLKDIENIKSIKIGFDEYEYIYLKNQDQISSLLPELSKDLIIKGIQDAHYSYMLEKVSTTRFNNIVLHFEFKIDLYSKLDNDEIDIDYPYYIDATDYPYPVTIGLDSNSHDNTQKWLMDNGYETLFK